MSLVRLQQIADVARLTRATVSRALRNDPRISEATRLRVSLVATTLGYRKNPYISALMTSLRTGAPTSVAPIIAFLNPRASRDSWKLNVPWAAMFRGAAVRAGELGFRLEEFWVADPGMPSSRSAEILRARGIRAAIVAIPEEDEPMNIDLSGMAAVAIDIDPVQKQLTHVSTDYFGNTMLALQSMRALGFSRIGLALIDWHPGYTKRLARAALLEFQEELPFADRGGCWIGSTQDMAGFAHWLEDRKPDAIVTTHWHPQAWLQSLGFRIPHDISVVQLDPGAVKFPVSCIDGRFEEVGAAAVDLLINQIHNHEFDPPTNPKHILHSGVWKAGWSAFLRTVEPHHEVYNEHRLATLNAAKLGKAGALVAARRPLFEHIYSASFQNIPATNSSAWRPLSLSPIANCAVRTPGAFYWLPEQDHLDLPAGLTAFRGVPFLLPDEKETRPEVAHVLVNGNTSEKGDRPTTPVILPIRERVRSLFFFHAAFYVSGPAVATECVLMYADGSEHTVALRPFFPPESAPEVAAFQDSWPAIPQFESASAKPVFVGSEQHPCRRDRFCYVWELVNPHPNIPVRSLKISPSRASSVVLLLVGVTALRTGGGADEVRAQHEAAAAREAGKPMRRAPEPASPDNPKSRRRTAPRCSSASN